MSISYPTFHLEVRLARIQPRIKRTLQISAGVHLHTLHRALQAVMGWQNQHEYEFVHRGRRVGERHPSAALFDVDSRRVRLWTMLLFPGDALSYLYDFGDHWIHRVTLQKVTRQPCKIPQCTAGQRACPQEDCGGVSAHMDMTDALSRPDSEEYTQWIRWLPGPYDPEKFDPVEAQQRLYHITDDVRLPEGQASLGALIDRFLRQQKERLQPSTYRNYRLAMDSLIRGFERGGHRYTSANPLEWHPLRHEVGVMPLLGYLGEFFDHHLICFEEAPKTNVKRCGTVLRSFLRWLHRDGHLTEQMRDYHVQLVNRLSRSGYRAAAARWHDFSSYWTSLGGKPDPVRRQVMRVIRVDGDRLEARTPANTPIRMRTDPDFARWCDRGMILQGHLARDSDGWLLFEAFQCTPAERGHIWGWR